MRKRPSNRLLRHALGATVLSVPLAIGGGWPVLDDASESRPTAGGGSVVVESPDALSIVERQVSSDMVVDWLEEPPGDASDWLAEPAVPADHRAQHQHQHHDDGPTDHDDGTKTSYAAAASGNSPAAQSSSGQGFTVFSASPRWLPTGYTIVLSGHDARIEQYRAQFVAAARNVETVTGVAVRVASGRRASAQPARGEIAVVLAEGPCGSQAVGCGGPAMTSTELVSGRVWIYPSALTMSQANRQNLAAHELGHALGLGHYHADFDGGRQMMFPVMSETTSFLAGDNAGLRFMAGHHDRPGGSITGHGYAAGQVHLTGTVTSGSRVRVTVGSKATEVAASGGRFATTIPATAGTHKVCARSLDAAPGFRRDLGCVDVVAPGTPSGHLEAVSSAFETIRVRGWAIDPQTADPVHIEIRHNAAMASRVRADGARPDVAARYRHHGPAHGFQFEVPAVAGANEICASVVGVGGGGNLDLGCRTVVHAVEPIGAFEVTQTHELGVTVSGWALDPNTPSPVHVEVAVDGLIPAVPGSIRADRERPGLAADHPEHGAGHGFSQRISLTPGEHHLCLTVVNVGLGSDRSLGCATVHVDEVLSQPAITPLADVTGSLPIDAVQRSAGVEALVTDVERIGEPIVAAVR